MVSNLMKKESLLKGNNNMIDKIICLFFGHKENYLEGLYIGEWTGWWCERVDNNIKK